MVDALQALRGIRLVTAATIMAEIGDLRRFETAGQLMSYLGWFQANVQPANGSHVSGITKAGNARVRRALVESAWTYRHLPRTSQLKIRPRQGAAGGS